MAGQDAPASARTARTTSKAGAYEEADAFHLSNGVVLSKSPDFDSAQDALVVVSYGGGLCVDPHGQVLKRGRLPRSDARVVLVQL